MEMGRKVTYDLLAVLDFNNVRKRMSVIGERESSVWFSRIFFPRKTGSGMFLRRTAEHTNIQTHNGGLSDCDRRLTQPRGRFKSWFGFFKLVFLKVRYDPETGS